MTDPWTDQLSEYIDGHLGPDECDALEAHLAVCAECRDVLDGLREVVDRAHRVEDRAPEADLWAGIAARIVAEPTATAGSAPTTARAGSRVRVPPPPAVPARGHRRFAQRRFSFTPPQLAAAGIVIALLSGSAVWLAQRTAATSPGARDLAQGAPVATGPAVSVARALGAADPVYAAAIADLERVLTEQRDRLDPATARVLEENLQIIDDAIRDAQRALAEDPASAYLNQHLEATMRRKLELLREAAAIVSAQT